MGTRTRSNGSLGTNGPVLLHFVYGAIGLHEYVPHNGRLQLAPQAGRPLNVLRTTVCR